MLYFVTAAGLVAHTYFWGLGLAWLTLPRRWRRWGWIFAPVYGCALQSAVVWAGAHAGLAGTDRYAWASEGLPAVLLFAAWRRRQCRAPRVGSIAGGAVVVLPAAWLLLSPLAVPGRGLTSSSLGSCDHADYAAGARVFAEFARSDRTGFLGQPEVTHVGTAESFFDFWLRLNHFTPSALLAHHASVFGVEPYRLVSVSAVVLALLNVPAVMFLARVATGVRGPWLAGLGAVYALSPVTAYAVHHGALGQLYAAGGIAVLTAAVIGAVRAGRRPGGAWAFLPLMLAAFWLLAGSYNFILTVGLAPAGAWMAAMATGRRDRAAVLRTLLVVAAALALCAGIFWGRFAGLAERFRLFEQFDFGWSVPLLTPEGWAGLVRDPALHAWPRAPRAWLGAAVVILWLAGGIALARWRRSAALAALALVLPVAVGWGILAREAKTRANASYDAYKLIAVFHPCLLAGLGAWLAAVRRRPRLLRLGAAATGVAILGGNVAVAAEFRRVMTAPPLRVDRTLAELARLEQEPRLASCNVLIDDTWSRLWANAFLLRKRQYFAIHTYEGRLNTALRGEWDLGDNPLRTVPFFSADYLAVNRRFDATRVGAPGRLRARFAAGWFDTERAGAVRWRWSAQQAGIVVTNPSDRSVSADLRLRWLAVASRHVTLSLAGRLLGVREVGREATDAEFAGLSFPPGETTLLLAAEEQGVAPGPADGRLLSVALYDFELRARAPEGEGEAAR